MAKRTRYRRRPRSIKRGRAVRHPRRSNKNIRRVKKHIHSRRSRRRLQRGGVRSDWTREPEDVETENNRRALAKEEAEDARGKVWDNDLGKYVQRTWDQWGRSWLPW